MRSTLTRSVAVGILALACALTGCASSTLDVTGTWGDPNVAGRPSIELSATGEVTGTDGCNRLMGSYEVEGNEVVFGPLASTMMYCEGVDTWMLNAASATVEGDRMTVYNLDGQSIGTLERSQ